MEKMTQNKLHTQTYHLFSRFKIFIDFYRISILIFIVFKGNEKLDRDSGEGRAGRKCPGGEEGVRQTNGHKARDKRVHPEYNKRICPQVNNSMEEKNDFWEDLDGLIESISKEERIVVGADLNGHGAKET